MRRYPRSRLTSLLAGLCLCTVFSKAGAPPQNLPEAVIRAHTVFLENETGFVELQYTAILELNKWGRLEVAESREKADLVVCLDSASHVRAGPDRQFPGPGTKAFVENDIPKGHTRIALLDPKTNAVLWSDTHKTEGGKVKSGHLLDGLREAFDSYERPVVRGVSWTLGDLAAVCYR